MNQCVVLLYVSHLLNNGYGVLLIVGLLKKLGFGETFSKLQGIDFPIRVSRKCFDSQCLSKKQSF